MVYHLKQLISGHATGTDLLEVPTIYKLYLQGLCKGWYTSNFYGFYMAQIGTVSPLYVSQMAIELVDDSILDLIHE